LILNRIGVIKPEKENRRESKLPYD
jgi:hypothetical protein